jgi:hypothetical protein
MYQKTKEMFTNPGVTLFTESDTRDTLSLSRSKIYPGLGILRSMEHICHFVKHVYPNMQKISKMTAVNGRRLLTKKSHRKQAPIKFIYFKTDVASGPGV